jgi:hypothetical protein
LDLEAFCREWLGAGVEREEFRRRSVGKVYGLRLDDGRRVVVKVHRADLFSLGHLAAVARVQRHLADGGFPAPRSLLVPVALDGEIVTAETLLDDGTWADAHEPAVRVAVARGLARFVAACGALGVPDGLHDMLAAAARLWEVPHDRRFNFPGTRSGAGWIDEIAARARSELDRAVAGSARVVGHADWRVEHLRFAGAQLAAVYDWDSLAAGPEPLVAGWAAHAFTADWSRPRLRCVPSLEESLAFLAHYEAARGAAFTDRERRLALAALVAATAYGARCEHSDEMTGAIGPVGDGYRRALERQRAELVDW